ncbi:MAG: tRNA uridine-5-carboxymethylaminomethyl(34) synthesis GTPase MnmE [Rhizobiaceae bacterium]|nr:tRNA uridine-5-carboxymethylaminomethyl(34) synthesis GTPase MnmE [Rhizobiaceae bacterium]
MSSAQHSPFSDETETADRSGRSTIVALSTGALPSGVAVVRTSGPAAGELVRRLAGTVPPARRAAYRTLRDADGLTIDRGIVLHFPAPDSFTGEECAEFHVHGGRAVVDALLGALCKVSSVRLAEPGEFTRRAFQNGKMTLLDSEALADLIEAETEAERRFAIQNGAGRHAMLYGEWRREIIRIWSAIEARLDFSDEDDVPDDLPADLLTDIVALEGRISQHLSGYRQAEMVRAGFDVVLLGAPNVGKSSLLNALAARQVAIVTDEPGTTRDLIELVLDLEGTKVRVTDTAGIRAPSGRVEEIGIARAVERASQAQLVLLLAPADGSAEFLEPPAGVDCLHVVTKIDMAGAASAARHRHSISTVTGAGLPDLIAVVAGRAAAHRPADGEVLPWKARHVELLRQAGAYLAQACAAGVGLEIRSERLRAAAASLGRIAGDVDVEDLLDAIFSSFCIGK